jgi:predicted TPR repeat methyltransferase
MNRAERRRGQAGGPEDRDFEEAVREALRLRNAGRLAQAESLCRRVLDAAPARIDALTVLGRILKSRERYGEAERVIRKALKRAPTDATLHNDLGNVHSAAGRHDEAARSYRRAIVNRPNFVEARFNLANALRVAGERDAAVEAYRRCLEIDPADSVGAALVLATLGAATPPPTPPKAYIESLFNDYAPAFESELRDRLGYRGPELMRDVASPLLPSEPKPAMLDIGCGTGLCGLVFAPLVASVDGIDLAPRMIEATRARGLYRRLERVDAVEFLRQTAEAWDLMVAGDLLIYLGDIAPLLGAAAARLRPGGLFVATAEVLEGEGYALRETLRYAHARSYIEAMGRAVGLSVAAWSVDEGRRQKGEAVPFHVFALKKA